MQSSSSQTLSQSVSGKKVVNLNARSGRLPPILLNKSRTPTPPAGMKKSHSADFNTLNNAAGETCTSSCNLPLLPSTDIKSSKDHLSVPDVQISQNCGKTKDPSASFVQESDPPSTTNHNVFNDVIPPQTPPNVAVLKGNHIRTKITRQNEELPSAQNSTCCSESSSPHSCPCDGSVAVQIKSHSKSSSSRSFVPWTFKQFRFEVDKWKKSKKVHKLQEFYRASFDSFKSINETFKKQRTTTPVTGRVNTSQQMDTLQDAAFQQKFVGCVYEVLLQMNSEIQKLVLKGIINCLLNEWKSEKAENDLRAYFILMQNPLFARIDTYIVYAHLLRQIATLNDGDIQTLTTWFRRLSTPRFRPLIERIHQFVTLRLFPGQSDELPPMTNCGWWIPSAIKVLSVLNSANNLIKPRLVSYREFYNQTLDHIDVMAEFRQWENPASHSGFTFCHFPFVLSLVAKLRILKHDQERQMVKTARDELVQSIRRRPTRAPNVNQLFFNITVRRQHLLQDSLDQIYSNRKHLKKKLRVEFVGEPGYDMGGLTKEWFLLLLRKVLAPEYNTFVYNERSRCYWFADNSSENSSDLFLVGVLMGLAVYNCITLDIRLPMVCYRKLLSTVPQPNSQLGHAADQCGSHSPSQTGPVAVTSTSVNPVGIVPVTLEDYKCIDPDMVHGLEELLMYDGNVEEDLDMTFETSYNDLGTMKTVALKPGGEKIAVTNHNRQEYVQAFLHYKLNKAVYRQFLAFHHGFYTVCCSNALSFLCPEELETLVCGNSGFDLRNLKKYTTYKGYVANDPTILYFWDVLFSMTRDLQKQFLHFCTGSDRVPVGGMQELNFKIVRTPTAQNMLPMAHTCFNQLLLPPYGSKQQLEHKLIIAVGNAEGFGLQ